MTMSSSVLKPEMMQAIPAHTLYIVVSSAMAGAMSWKLPTWYFGFPSSGSHALIGGLVGAGIVGIGAESILVEKVTWNVLLPLFSAPLVSRCSWIRDFFDHQGDVQWRAPAHRSVFHGPSETGDGIASR